MPDISMCANGTCPIRRDCYRSPDSGTKPNERRQSWMTWEPSNATSSQNVMCHGFMELWPKRASLEPVNE